MDSDYRGNWKCPVCNIVSRHFKLVIFDKHRKKHVCLECANRHRRKPLTVKDVYKGETVEQLKLWT